MSIAPQGNPANNPTEVVPVDFSIDFHEPTQRFWLYVPAGSDPKDGAPLTWARPASPAEVMLWEMGDYDSLRQMIQGHAPLAMSRVCTAKQPRRKPWSRWVRKLFGRGG